MMANPRVLFFVTVLAACVGGDDGGDDDPETARADRRVSWPEVPVPAAASDDWCQRVRGGPAGARTPLADLGVAHALARFFGPGEYHATDQALLDAVDAATAGGANPLSGAGVPAVVAAYDAALASVCAAPAAGGLGPVQVEQVGAVAIVTPGTGAVVLPAGTEAVAIDLRDLPEDPALAAALAAAVAPAIAMPVDGASAEVRRHDGMTDEYFTPQSTYRNSVEVWREPALAGSAGRRDLPLAVLTDATLAPTAARFAGTLRLAGRAWLLGEDLRTEVAEARWAGVGTGGLAVRTRRLVDGGDPWPDVIAADVRSVDPRRTAEVLASAGRVPRWRGGGDATRAAILPAAPFGVRFPPAATTPVRQTAPLVAYGALRTFYPYFDVVGDHLDARLDEVVAAAATAPADRVAVRALLRRFGQAISDGHQFVFGVAFPGALPVMWELAGGLPVARRSLVPEIARGDTLVAVGDTPIEAWLADQYTRAGGATDGYRFDLAMRELDRTTGPLTLGLRAPDGAVRTITVALQPLETRFQLGSVPERRGAGFLADLGAPSVYYLNLSGEVLPSDAAFTEALTAAIQGGASGLVLDMRGYPGGNHYAWMQQLASAPFRSPQFVVPTWRGPDELTWATSQYHLQPVAGPKPTMPIVLLVGPHTVSAAENFALMVVDALDVTVVGVRSAGTNGNITGVQLPGDFAFTFTGMRLLRPGGEPFHGIGIVPDVPVELTAQAIAAGDPELAAALDVLAP